MFEDVIMVSEETEYFNSLEEYRNAEAELHTELINISRRYLPKLGIVSLVGVLDVVKQEVRELERVSRGNIDDAEETKQKKVEIKGSDYF